MNCGYSCFSGKNRVFLSLKYIFLPLKYIFPFLVYVFLSKKYIFHSLRYIFSSKKYVSLASVCSRELPPSVPIVFYEDSLSQHWLLDCVLDDSPLEHQAGIKILLTRD